MVSTVIQKLVRLLVGLAVTCLVQSSSVTTVMVVGFVNSGIMTLIQAVGVIFGANIGTTITAQIVAFKVTKAALLMVAIGFAMLFVTKKERIKQYGTMLMGLGLVFFGMSLMSDAMKPLRSYQPFLDLMIQMENPLVGILIAAGCVMETTPNIVILAPILKPLADNIGMNEIQFCIMMITALGVGFITPPLGLNLFVVSGITGESILKIAARAVPFVFFMLIVVLMIAYIPAPVPDKGNQNATLTLPPQTRGSLSNAVLLLKSMKPRMLSSSVILRPKAATSQLLSRFR